MPTLSEDLAFRGLVHQVTDPALLKRLDAGGMTVYAGFDPTADTLHVGNMLQLCTLRRFQLAGHRPISLAGGGTGMIGDPGGKLDERAMLTKEVLSQHLEGIRPQLAQFLDLSNALLLDNSLWLSQMTMLDFLRDVGKHFAVNQMIQRDSVKARFESRESGISYTEFSYMLLQAYDFHELNRRHGCRLQVGASDQWGNIVSGVDLVRRLSGDTVYGLTAPLLTNSEGKKYGKSEKGAVFLDGSLTSPFDFYQFWFNSADADVGRFLRWLTVRGREEIEALEASPGAERRAQRALAEDLTRRVHGGEAVAEVQRALEALFGGGDLRAVSGAILDAALGAAPSVTVERARFEGQGALLVDLLAEVGACPSKSDARRQIAAGAIAVNGTPLAGGSAETRLRGDDLIDGRLVVLRRGKRNNYVVRVR
jgi:tyrosyl-tRNA synthetase